MDACPTKRVIKRILSTVVLVNDTYFLNAAATGCLKCVRHLVRNGCCPNGSSTITPIHRAITNRRVEMVKYLAEVKADINIQVSENLHSAWLVELIRRK